MAAAVCCGDHDLSVDVRTTPSAITVVLVGELDLASHDRIRMVVGTAIDEASAHHHARVVVDASGLSYVDCSSLRTLSSLAARARERGTELVLSRPTPLVRRMLRLTGYEGELRVSPCAESFDR
jgi:anti-anti-sigma factor